ncbi:hypothetical protein V7S43_015462 [Phytophthora oleae]|uniref:Crinkler effector protein N-terminal domain-containing protein n=1 Tax=Phytophthora oleae TaxID=2107226 RepID=A0ABD3F1H0_9STRA
MEEVTLMCALLREGGVDVFPVVIGKSKVVGLLQDAIKAKKPKKIKCDADELRLFLAKTVKEGDTVEGEAKKDDEQEYVWLSSSTEDVKELKKGEKTPLIEALTEEGKELQAEDPLEDVLSGVDTPLARQIHVLVVVPEPERAGENVASCEPTAPLTAMPRHPERLKRWDAINKMIRQKNQVGNEKTSNQETNRKRKNRDANSSVAYSSLSWADLKPILPMEVFNLQAKTVPDDVEAKRQLFILAIIEAVCLLHGDVTILVEEEVEGKSVRVHGCFEFVLERGLKRISIVEAKRDDIAQGVAQIVAGLEALCDVEKLETSVGIVSDYRGWTFISDEDTRIRRIDKTLDLTDSVPSANSLKMILGMFTEMLSNST